MRREPATPDEQYQMRRLISMNQLHREMLQSLATLGLNKIKSDFWRRMRIAGRHL
jgi:hypothetical protein